MNKFLASLFGISLLLLYSCEDQYPDYAYVNFYIETESAEYFNLNYGGRGWEYFEGGARGVIVFRRSWDNFIAFERTCVAKDCHGRLEVDETNDVLICCPKCDSKYIYYDGSPLEGSKARSLLYTYCTFFDGNYLWVNNCN
jgi:nitrite reductase/ring-hydroxylating ferredoxin subunit